MHDLSDWQKGLKAHLLISWSLLPFFGIELSVHASRVLRARIAAIAEDVSVYTSIRYAFSSSHLQSAGARVLIIITVLKTSSSAFLQAISEVFCLCLTIRYRSLVIPEAAS